MNATESSKNDYDNYSNDNNIHEIKYIHNEN